MIFAIIILTQTPQNFKKGLTIADLTEVDVSTKPEVWTGKEVDLVKGARLIKADLRFAEAESAFLVKADLRYAKLQNADLWVAELQNANLRAANLTSARYLTVEQLSEVKTLYEAKLAPELLDKIKEKYPHLLEKPEPDGSDENE